MGQDRLYHGTSDEALANLTNRAPFPLQVLAAIPVETDAHRIERRVHAFLEAERRRGEWFDVPIDLPTLKALIVRAVAYFAAQEASQDRGEMAQTIGRTLGDYVIAERVRTAREWRGWSQQELARRAEIHPVVLNRLEKKHKVGVQAETIRRLAMALRVSADYLLGITNVLGGWHETEDLIDPTTPQPQKRQRTRHTKAYASELA